MRFPTLYLLTKKSDRLPDMLASLKTVCGSNRSLKRSALLTRGETATWIGQDTFVTCSLATMSVMRASTLSPFLSVSKESSLQASVSRPSSHLRCYGRLVNSIRVRPPSEVFLRILASILSPGFICANSSFLDEVSTLCRRPMMGTLPCMPT